MMLHKFVARSLFLFIVTAALASRERDYLDDYFEQVVAKFNQKLEEENVSSLPVKDVILDINNTISGVKIIGTVGYSNTIVVDVGPLEMQKEGHRGEPDDDGVHLFYQINFPNLTLFSDVTADFESLGSQKGTAELLFLNTSISVYLDKNYTLSTTDVETRPYATMGPATNFLPVSEVMDAAALLARLELGYRLLWDQLNDWCLSRFTPIMIQVIDEIEFPMFPPVTTPAAHSD